MQIKNYTKCFEISTSKIPQFSNSFFVKTVFEWNHLEETIVRIPSVDSRSETALVYRQYIDGALSTVVLKPVFISTTFSYGYRYRSRMIMVLNRNILGGLWIFY